ncbi:hypothetical protein, partial [Microbispora sp. CSR-4]|uniref:hypothetical protein n=1 Tax=Microbispora sp. CSR-4 TaxID=2592813 RepID=UPI001C9C27E9
AVAVSGVRDYGEHGCAFPTDVGASVMHETYMIIGKVHPFPEDPQVLSIAPRGFLHTSAPQPVDRPRGDPQAPGLNPPSPGIAQQREVQMKKGKRKPRKRLIPSGWAVVAAQVCLTALNWWLNRN